MKKLSKLCKCICLGIDDATPGAPYRKTIEFEIMRTEAPISRSLLSSRIFNAYGILRKTARLIEWMDGILDKPLQAGN